MAEQLSGATGQSLGAPLGGLTGTLQGGISTLTSSGKGMLDRWFPPEKRENLMAKLTKFATEKPMLASFLLSQIALSGVPLSLFAVMTVGVLVFALVAGLVIAVLGALLFTVFCVGVALIILLPTLFATTFAAAFIWLWGVGAYYILKWFNDKDVPGIHTGMADGVVEQSGIKENLPDGAPDFQTNGEANGTRKYDVDDDDEKVEEQVEQGKEDKQSPPKLPKKQAAEHREKASSAKTTGASVQGGVGNVTKKGQDGLKQGQDGLKQGQDG